MPPENNNLSANNCQPTPITPTDDFERKLGKAIIEGNDKVLSTLLKEEGKENQAHFLGQINTNKLKDVLEGKFVYIYLPASISIQVLFLFSGTNFEDLPPKLCCLDLAILCDRDTALETLLKHGTGKTFPAHTEQLNCVPSYLST